MPRVKPDLTPEADRLEALAAAADEYLTASTAAELAFARAESRMIEAVKAARHRPALPWRTIAATLGVSHQAAMKRWGPKIRPPRRHTPVVSSTEPNRTQTTTGEQQ